jgi:hypothetical protein
MHLHSPEWQTSHCGKGRSEVKRRDFLGCMAALTLSGGGRDAGAAIRDQAFRRVRPGEPGWPPEVQWQRLGQRVNGRSAPATVAVRRLPKGESACRDVFARLANPYEHRRRPGADADARLGERLDHGGQRVGRRRRDARGRRGCGRFCPRASPAPGGQGWRTQLPGHVLLEGLAPGLDAAHESDPPCTMRSLRMARRHRHSRNTRCPSARAPSGCTFTAQSRWKAAIRAGWRLRHGRRGGPRSERWVWQLFERFRHGSGRPSRGGSRDGDGTIRVVNAHRDPELFWALKGGGGGSFGVVTRLTLRTRELPETICAVFGKIRARSDGTIARSSRGSWSTIAITSSTRIGANKSSSTTDP